MPKKKISPRSADGRDNEIGRRIRLIRTERRISQQELGDLLGVSFQQIQKYEKGYNRLAAARLIDIANVMKISPIALIPIDDKGLSTEAIDVETYRLAKAFKGLRPEWQRAVRTLINTLMGTND